MLICKFLKFLHFRPLRPPAREPVLVTLDVGSLGNNDKDSIENVIKQAMHSGSLGKYRLSPERFSTRDFGGRKCVNEYRNTSFVINLF